MPSLNDAVDEFVVSDPVNATLPYSDTGLWPASVVFKTATTPGTPLNDRWRQVGLTHEIFTAMSFLAKRGGDVVVVTQNLIDPRDPRKADVLQRNKCWNPRHGVLIGNRMPKVPGLGSPLAWNILFNSMDKCTEAYLHIKGLDLKTYSVQAAVNGTTPVDLKVLDVVALQRSTFWDYKYEYDPGMESELTFPPLMVEQKNLHTPTEIQRMPECQMIPQCTCIDGDPPVHWISLVVATDGEHVYAVVIDPTWGQFNPEGVIEGAELMKRLIPGYSALHLGAPKAFNVGEHTPGKSPREQVLEWFRQSPDESLRGASIGKLGDYRVVYQD